MSAIAERIRSFREDKPLPKSRRKPFKKNEFWWLDEESVLSKSNSSTGSISILDKLKEFYSIANPYADADDVLDERTEEEVDARLLPQPEAMVKRRDIEAEAESEVKHVVETISTQIEHVDEPTTEKLLIEALPSLRHDDVPYEPVYDLTIPTNTRDKEAAASAVYHPTSLVMNQILEKEYELTKYLDSHIDDLFDRVDNILEEFGISSPTKATALPVAAEPQPNDGIGELEPMANNSLSINSSNEISRSLSAISCKSSDLEENVHLPMRISIDSDILPNNTNRLKSTAAAYSTQRSDDVLNNSSQIGSRSPFFYLSSSFESEDPLCASSSSTDARELSGHPEKVEVEHVPSRTGGKENDEEDDLLSEELVLRYLHDEVVRSMWNRLKHLEAMLDKEDTI
jgi:predicted glycoside hydrolase/deacetylase ChbG (UPF0249 family)